MKRIAAIALVLGCGSKDAKIPDDHRLHQMITADRTLIVGKAVDVSTIPIGDALGGLPVSGTADVDIDVKAKKHDYARANGHVIVHCTDCRIGDDKATLPPLNDAYALSIGPIYVGHIDVGNIDVEVAIADGQATIQHFSLTSKDLELTLTGGATLATQIEDMKVELCLRFKPTDALAARDPKTHALLSVTGAFKADDGFYSIRFTDRLSMMKKLAQVCGGTAPPPTDVQTHPVLPTP